MTLGTYEGNLSWPVEVRTGASGRPWAAFGLVTDDHERFEVVAFGSAVDSCAGLGKGSRVRVTSNKPPQPREWTAAGALREGLRLVASRVEVLEPLPAGEARRKILDRIMATPAEKVLGV